MRGTKLKAWRIPLVWKDLQENVLSIPEGSFVPSKQELMLRSTQEVLNAIAADVRGGLLETVGVESSISLEDERCSMILALPATADPKKIAEAIDAENVEAWQDGQNRVHLAINPWYSTKDVDQTVLCAIKVIHVLLGLHAVCEVKPKTFGQKLLSSLRDVLNAQQEAKKTKD
ncbi:MAG: hypothetical protein ABJA66_08430 [Actinomycetota bacterium]